MLTRGISLLIGGYPNEMQMLMMINAGYVLATSNFFFFYFLAIALLFLIGQRTQRSVLLKELDDEQNGSYRRINDTEEGENSHNEGAGE